MRESTRINNLVIYEKRICSELAEVECLRALDRMKLAGVLGEGDLASRHAALRAFLDICEIAELTKGILKRACSPLPVVLGALDTIHLVTAFTWRESNGGEIVMATHDLALARAARIHVMEVVGA